MFPTSTSTSVLLKLSVLIISLQGILAQQQIPEDLSQTALQADAGQSLNPIEALFGSGYICLHVDDPKFAESPAFQALADELTKKYKKPVQIGHNDTEVPDEKTIHIKVEPTPRPKPIPIRCTEPGYFTNPNNCSKFYRCIEPIAKGKQMRINYFDCGPGTIFDEKMHACNYPQSVEPKPACWLSDDGIKGVRGRDPKPETTTTPEPEQISQVDDGLKQDNQVPEDGNPFAPDDNQDITDDGDLEMTHSRPPVEPDQATEPPPMELHVEPVCTESGTFPHPTDCKKYHECSPGKGKLLMIRHKCGHGQIYDPNEYECRPQSEVHPKPKCWHKKKHERVTTIVETLNETIIDEDIRDPEPVTEPVPIPIVPEPEAESVEDHFDEVITSGITQQIVHPGKHGHHHKNETVTIVKEEITEVYESSESEEKPPPPTESQRKQSIRNKVKLRKIEQPTGPKPVVKCTKAGTHAHPTDCNKYYRCDKKGKGFKTWYFECAPVGTVYDEAAKTCKLPADILPTIPECAKWDDEFRELFEEVEIVQELVDEKPDQVDVNVAVDQEWIDEDQKVDEVKTLPPAPVEQEAVPEVKEDDEWELVPDGKGGHKRVKKVRKVITEIQEIITTESSEESTEQDVDGNRKKKGGRRKDQKGKHREKKPEDEVTSTTPEPIDVDLEPVHSAPPPDPHTHHHHEEFTQVNKTVIETVDVFTDSREDVPDLEQTHSAPKPEPEQIDQVPVDIDEQTETNYPDNFDNNGDLTLEPVHAVPPKEETTTELPAFDDGVKGVRGKDPKEPTTTTPLPMPEDVETIPPVHNCDDELELIKRLTRERDTAEATADRLEKDKAKLEARLKKVESDLNKAVRAKEKMRGYVDTMDKTIESYKKQVEELKLCCPNPEAEELVSYTKKGRKRRSVIEDEGKSPPFETGVGSFFNDEFLTKKMKVRKMKSHEHGAHLPLHVTAESVGDELVVIGHPPIDSSIGRSLGQHSGSEAESRYETMIKKLEVDANSALYSHIPILIVLCLLVLLLTCMLLGSLIMRRLNRMTMYGISQEELEAYAKLSAEAEKVTTLRQSSQKNALRQGTYFTYVDE